VTGAGRERSGPGDGGPPGGIGCEEALARVYEYLDGELEPSTQERIHRHLEICERCYPYFDFERLFLDHVREKGLRSGDSDRLRRRLESLFADAG